MTPARLSAPVRRQVNGMQSPRTSYASPTRVLRESYACPTPCAAPDPAADAPRVTP
jgi:hypothetical protein